VHRRTGGACSASGGDAVCSGVTHRRGCGEARMGFDPGDGQVVIPADCGDEAPDSLNEGLVAARFDGVVPEEADAVLTVCKEVDAPPCHSRGEPVSAANPLTSVIFESAIFERLVSDGNSDGAVANPSMPLESSEDIAQFDEGINNMGEVVRSDEWAVQLVAREHASQTSPSPPTTLVSCSIPEDPTPVPCDTAHSRHSAIPEHMNDSGAHKENLRVRGEGEAILPPIGTVLRVPEVQSRPDVPTIYSVTSTSLPALPPPSSSGSANQRRESKPTKPDVSDLEVVKQLRQALRGRAEVQ